MSDPEAVLTSEMIDRLVEKLRDPGCLEITFRNTSGDVDLYFETRPEPELIRVTGRERVRYNVALARDFYRSNLHGGFW